MLGNIKLIRQRRSSWAKPLANERGFTLTELLISISLIGIISVSLLAIITNYFATMTRNNTLIEMTVESQNLLRATVEQIRYGAGVRQTNTIADPNVPSGWNTSNVDFVIIIAVPATDANKDYIIDPDTGNPYNNELVYFKQNSILYRRALAHPDATGNTQKTSCPESSASPTCPADIVLIDNLNDMVFTLYDQDNNTTTDPLLARSVNINLALYKDTFGEPLTLDINTRTTLRNQF